MPFTEKDKAKLVQVHPKLGGVLEDAIKIIDFIVVYGLRDKEIQDRLYAEKKSQLRFPYSKHNKTSDPLYNGIEYTVSDAVDIVPRNTLYADVNRICFLMGVVQACAVKRDVKLRFGLDFNQNNIFENKENGFFDAAHVELIW